MVRFFWFWAGWCTAACAFLFILDRVPGAIANGVSAIVMVGFALLMERLAETQEAGQK